jgi:hypothetical protein
MQKDSFSQSTAFQSRNDSTEKDLRPSSSAIAQPPHCQLSVLVTQGIPGLRTEFPVSQVLIPL